MARIEPYIDYVHIREKGKGANEIALGVEELIQQGIPNSKIIINDRVDIAVIKQVYGVQLAYHSLAIKEVKVIFPKLIVGKSVHSIKEAQKAELSGTNYVLFGHIYETNSKLNLKPKGVEELRKLVQSVHLPVVAIGGIQPEHIPTLRQTGIKGIALMSSITNASDPLDVIKKYRQMEVNQ